MGRFFISAWLSLFMSVATGLLLIGSHFFGDLWGWRTVLLVVLWASNARLSFQNFKKGQSRCWLSWDGHSWRIQTLLPEFSTEVALQACYEINVHLDLQHLIFVSLQNEQGERHWFWLRQGTFPDRWHGFRCAVYSRSEDLSS